VTLLHAVNIGICGDKFMDFIVKNWTYHTFSTLDWQI